MQTKEYVENLGRKAAAAKAAAGVLSEQKKNEALMLIADEILEESENILKANEKDVENGKNNGMSPALIDRLKLSAERLEGMARGVRDIAALPDPVGKVLNTVTRPNGLVIKKVRVPMGVIGIIYEARPNVTSDAAAICLKAGSAVVLRGGKDALYSNTAIVNAMKKALNKAELDENLITFIDDTSRESSSALMTLNEYIDLLIPRGGAGLINSVVKNATVPVIKTGTGNCHAYVDESADFKMATDIIFNGKTQRIGVCNALESVVIHKNIIKDFLPLLVNKLREKSVTVYGDKTALSICPDIEPASEEDFYTEYLDYKISVKTVANTQSAIAWINEHSTGHSEVIITESEADARRFLQQIDSSSVYHNASTRFTDGGEFGLGAEIGISTQKLHARGPMGIEEITSYKFMVFGDGQVRK